MTKDEKLIPEMVCTVEAGFAKAADDYIERYLDLNELVVKHPESTFFVRVHGDSMIEAGIQSGDILAVDKSLNASHGKIVIAVINGEFTVKKFVKSEKGVQLAACNKCYKPIVIKGDTDFSIWGVVTYVISPR